MWTLTLLFAALAALQMQVQAQKIRCDDLLLVIPASCCSGSGKILKNEINEACGYSKNPFEVPSCDTFKCILKQKDILTSNNKVDKTKALDSSTYPPEWKATHETSTKICLAEVDKGKSDCDAHLFGMCYTQQIFLNCPAEYWSGSPDCTNAKLLLQSCTFS